MSEGLNERLLLADRFFAQATATTEAAMRSSLSRLYYASYHVAAAITDGKSHGDIAKKLMGTHGELGEKFRSLHDLRSQMDYRPDFFLKELAERDPGDWYQEQMGNGIRLYYELRAVWDAAQQVNA